MIPVIDLHADTYSKAMRRKEFAFLKQCYYKVKDNFEPVFNTFHITFENAKKGNVRVQTQSLFMDDFMIPSAFKYAVKMLHKMKQDCAKDKDFIFLQNKQDLLPCMQGDKYGIMPSIEGLEVIENDLELLSFFADEGIRVVAPTWNRMLPYITPVGMDGGLLTPGKEVLKKMKDLDFILDVSHMSDQSFFDAERIYSGKIMASHSNARSVIQHNRNLSDDQLKVLKERDGILGLNLATYFLEPENKKGNAFEWLWAMIEYIGEKFGTQLLAFGGDLDGIPILPKGISNCSFYPEFAKFLKTKGLTKQEIEAIFYKNAQRILS